MLDVYEATRFTRKGHNIGKVDDHQTVIHLQMQVAKDW